VRGATFRALSEDVPSASPAPPLQPPPPVAAAAVAPQPPQEPFELLVHEVEGSLATSDSGDEGPSFGLSLKKVKISIFLFLYYCYSPL